MAFKRITENDMLGKGNVGKPDTPGVSTSEMQRIMDELPREVIAPAFNELSGQLEADTASADIGANAPDGITPDPAPAENSPAKLQSVLQGIVNKITDHIADQVKHVTSEERTSWNNASNDRHTHDNKSILDGITSSLVGNWNAAFAHVSDAVRHITENERTNWNDKYTKSETDKAINERVVEIGSSDMTKAVYDPETRNLPYIPKIDAEALTLGKNVVLSGAPVSIAYAGAQRIAAITAYGETPQGGTTEAPVALTGVDSVQVCGRNLLPHVEKNATMRGVTIVSEKDGYILDGTATGYISFDVSNIAIPAGNYVLSAFSGSTEVGARIRIGANRSVLVYGKETKSFDYTGGTLKVEIVVKTPSSVLDNVFIAIQLNLGSTAMPYEPYQGSVTQLPIPLPLHEVGDVRDVCRTRVKSIYDKRIVLDGTEIWTEYNDEGWKGDGYHVYRFYDADAVIGQPIASNNYPSRMGSNNFKGTLGVATGGQSILFSVIEQETVDDWKAYLIAQKNAGTPVIVYRQSTAYDGTNGLDVCMTEYQTGFVELDGTEPWIQYSTSESVVNHKAYILATENTVVSTDDGNGVLCSIAPTKSPATAYSEDAAAVMSFNSGNIALQLQASIAANLTEFKAYLAAQKAAGTPVQVAYQLFTPETYATDPIDFDNAAGPLTVMTGGEVEVRMTELIGSRSPELTGKMDKEVYAQVGNPSELDNDNFLHCVNQRGVSGTISTAGYFIDRWKLVSGTVQITTNGLVLNGTISQTLENAAGTDVAASASAGTASYDNSTKTFTLTATGQTITWAKLEKGSVATPYVPKGYGAELVECYRYFWISSMPVNIFKTTAGDYFRNTVYFPIAMRTVPSVTILASNGTVSINAVTIDAVKFAGDGGNDTVTRFSASADL